MFSCRRALYTLLGFASLSFICSSSLDEYQPLDPMQGTLHRRNYFYVGGEYVPKGKSSIAAGQIYVERLTPEHVTQLAPIVIIPGHAMTGTNFLNTPDGRLGWADYFLSEGFEVSFSHFYLVFYAN